VLSKKFEIEVNYRSSKGTWFKAGKAKENEETAIFKNIISKNNR